MSTALTPTADVVARTIVAACRETGEDPLACASATPGLTVRARHYAMWALVHVYQGIKPGLAAALVGAPGKPAHFYNNSRMNALPGRRPGGGGWWEADAYSRVIAATEAAAAATPAPPSERLRALADLAKTEKVSVEPARPAEPAPYRHQPPPFKDGPLPPHDARKLGPTTEAPATRLKRVLGDLGPPRRTAVEEGLERRARERVECRDLLAEAAANTAKLPVPKAEGDD